MKLLLDTEEEQELCSRCRKRFLMSDLVRLNKLSTSAWLEDSKPVVKRYYRYACKACYVFDSL